MTTNTAIMMKGVSPPPAGAPPAACAMASGINEFMVLSHGDEQTAPARARRGRVFWRKTKFMPQRLVLTRPVPVEHSPAGPVQRSRFDPGPQASLHFQVVMQVVDGVEPAAQDLV